MFDILWRLRGSVALGDGPADEAALDRMEQLLQLQRKPVTERSAGHLAPKSGSTRPPGRASFEKGSSAE